MDEMESPPNEGRDTGKWDRWSRQVTVVVVAATPPIIALATLVKEVVNLFS